MSAMAMQTTARTGVSVPRTATAGGVRRGMLSTRMLRRDFAGKALLKPTSGAARVSSARRTIKTTATASNGDVDTINLEALLAFNAMSEENEELRENRRVVVSRHALCVWLIIGFLRDRDMAVSGIVFSLTIDLHFGTGSMVNRSGRGTAAGHAIPDIFPPFSSREC